MSIESTSWSRNTPVNPSRTVERTRLATVMRPIGRETDLCGKRSSWMLPAFIKSAIEYLGRTVRLSVSRRIVRTAPAEALSKQGAL